MYTRNQLQLHRYPKRQRIVIADIADREIVLMRAKQPDWSRFIKKNPASGRPKSGIIHFELDCETESAREFVATREICSVIRARADGLSRARFATRWTSKIGKSLSTTVRYHVFLRLPCDKGIIIQKVYCQRWHLRYYICIILDTVSFLIYMRGTGGPGEKHSTTVGESS